MPKLTLNRVLGALGMVIGVVYLVNPGAGLIELIPDVVPFVGNLDEAGATVLLMWGLQTLRQPVEAPITPPALPGSQSIETLINPSGVPTKRK
ncbi:MAG: hypothetical protein Fur005_00650 [Roseiflexaceae bacterium]